MIEDANERVVPLVRMMRKHIDDMFARKEDERDENELVAAVKPSSSKPRPSSSRPKVPSRVLTQKTRSPLAPRGTQQTTRPRLRSSVSQRL
ncbi:hypothetical protein BC629DRAFT_667995 [Irpex lacteus]|nr:hypothetical protein BC629DRAFT_667995 [Irpex lacteus]